MIKSTLKLIYEQIYKSPLLYKDPFSKIGSQQRKTTKIGEQLPNSELVKKIFENHRDLQRYCKGRFDTMESQKENKFHTLRFQYKTEDNINEGNNNGYSTYE